MRNFNLGLPIIFINSSKMFLNKDINTFYSIEAYNVVKNRFKIFYMTSFFNTYTCIAQNYTFFFFFNKLCRHLIVWYTSFYLEGKYNHHKMTNEKKYIWAYYCLGLYMICTFKRSDSHVAYWSSTSRTLCFSWWEDSFGSTFLSSFLHKHIIPCQHPILIIVWTAYGPLGLAGQ